ncbi:glyoxalase [Bacillus coahuilensis m2-6]|uniref:Glyoxalase n=1 Tax=Bacillus coahuilensis p1.1.43 TaxID=1150625 RepID=A0A147K9A3_9BACI|nr:VOC family protein [Bacillus coahuilensis]KUP06924.1 glyoxalase [Bacillus coahuilensis p1.1.43]KUP08415.1 glyoxalase [Bacillus coahuilensis m2-6]
MIEGIDHIQITAPKGCEEEARAFYGGILKMVEIPKPSHLQLRGGCWFQCGNQEVHIGVEEPFKPTRKGHPGFIVKSIEEVKAHFDQKNVSFLEDEPIEGRERIFVLDPFGNRLEFLSFTEE